MKEQERSLQARGFIESLTKLNDQELLDSRDRQKKSREREIFGVKSTPV